MFSAGRLPNIRTGQLISVLTVYTAVLLLTSTFSISAIFKHAFLDKRCTQQFFVSCACHACLRRYIHTQKRVCGTACCYASRLYGSRTCLTIYYAARSRRTLLFGTLDIAAFWPGIRVLLYLPRLTVTFCTVVYRNICVLKIHVNSSLRTVRLF